MANTNFRTIEDLLASESFMAWYHRTNEEHIQIWDEWITASTENKELASAAVRLLKAIQVKERSISHQKVEKALNRILNSIQTDPHPGYNTKNHSAMFKNYLTVAIRNMWKNKTFSGLNLLGLALGMACSLLILLWVQDEKSIDAFHDNKDRLYTVYERQYFDGKIEAGYFTPGLLPDELKRMVPQIEYACGYSGAWGEKNTFSVGDKILKKEGCHAGNDFFAMFTFPLLQGNAQKTLQNPNSIAVSRNMAENFFGSPQAAMGKAIRYENRKDFIITAVFENISVHASEKFDFVINWKSYLDDQRWAAEWGNNGPRTYIMLRKDANPAQVEARMTKFLDNYNKEQSKSFYIQLGLQRYDEMYLHSIFKNGKISGGRIEYVRLFSIVAVFILLIACINFMNLTTARSVKRAREIGVRKVVGAARPALIRQFIGEAVLMSFMALLISLVLVTILLPLFNSITTKQIGLPYNTFVFWASLLGLALITGILSGSYPALFLSAFKPVVVLKGMFRFSAGAAWFRKGLVVFQFTLSILLIIGTIIVSRQVQYIQSKNLGYDRDNFVYLPLEGDLVKKYTLFKEQALRLPGIQLVTRITQTPTQIENGTGGVDWDGKDPNLTPMFTQASAGYDLVRTLKLQLAEGRDFSRDHPTDTAGYLVNEAALKKIGYKDPVGKRLTFWDKKGTIIGVLKDFHFNSLHTPINPLIIRFGEQDTWGTALIRTEAGKTSLALDGLRKLCKELNPAFPFTYQFSDEEYQKLYASEEVIRKLSNYFAFLGIFISCLGLLGLAMFTAEQRTKEFGIRKVLGAPVSSLFTLLSKDFLLLVAISFVIASPLAWWAMDNWLQNFVYRTHISIWIFLLAGVVALLIALFTVSFQAVKTAIANPVTALRSE